MAQPTDVLARPSTQAPDEIKAVPLRHPGRVAAAVILIAALAVFIYGAATNDAYQWNTYFAYLFDERISQAALVTITLTVLSMILGLVLGVVLAIMRLSPNRVLNAVAWGYIWIFRGTPVYVQLVFWGLLSTIYRHVDIGIPFGGPVFFSIDSSQWLQNVFVLSIVGLGLNEAAYLAEIVRAGISSVDRGQTEAATALGLSWTQTLNQVVLPQAMRVIIPPAGNEVISMLKTTSLVTAVPFTLDLYSRARDLSIETFNPVPMLLVASTWYLAITSILMIGQYYLERHYGRGSANVSLTNR
ncbi:amino acid ABC transporter permease [Microbacterium candidum]|uniref:Amino acid ABC transporter permease n=1 Tax=Microbacterium candidum TaxID=3041922 RepID=A0ABT7N3I2_9MICO|nr:amino acid ABC transporter permease [Microbacterium sp. ASV49]MDL9981264.1 amino acid ABC transporter permease [Microbacterium sp. ASV49]